MSTFLYTLSKFSNEIFFRPEKLDPNGPAYEKMQKTKKFDPNKSQVLNVMKEQENGRKL